MKNLKFEIKVLIIIHSILAIAIIIDIITGKAVMGLSDILVISHIFTIIFGLILIRKNQNLNIIYKLIWVIVILIYGLIGFLPYALFVEFVLPRKKQ